MSDMEDDSTQTMSQIFNSSEIIGINEDLPISVQNRFGALGLNQIKQLEKTENVPYVLYLKVNFILCLNVNCITICVNNSSNHTLQDIVVCLKPYNYLSRKTNEKFKIWQCIYIKFLS